ncbi:MAG: hypothetical protein AAGE05_03830 [Pseudomonadota bacterium]
MALDRMNAQDLLRLLPDGSLLSACEPDQLDDLLSRSKVEFAAKRETLIHQAIRAIPRSFSSPAPRE